MRFFITLAVAACGFPAFSAELQIGHYVNNQKVCQARESWDNDKGRTNEIWFMPDGNALYGGENNCEIKGSKLDCEGGGDSDNFIVNMKIAADGRSFTAEKQKFTICPDDVLAVGKQMLPMKPGFYVDTDVECSDWAYAVMQGYSGDTLSYGHGTCNITNVEQAGPSHKISADCFNPDDTKPIKETFYFTIKGKNAYSWADKPGQKFNKGTARRWCGPTPSAAKNWTMQ